MSFRTTLIIINLAAVLGLLIFIAYRVVSLRRNPEPEEPENLTPFFEDDVLEGPHLERVLGVALVSLVVAVVALVGYFIWEPFRAADATDAFKDRSVERGELLYAGPSSEAFDSSKSLNCARCHGDEGTGGVATQVIKSTDPRCAIDQTVNEELAEDQPYCLPQQVSWAAPNLTLAPLRYNRAQLTQIITYGRPGTPMPAWGVKSGKGALNEQSIQDLVNYLYSINTTPEKAQAGAAKDADAMRETLESPEVRAAAAKWVADTAVQLQLARAALAALPLTASAEARNSANSVVEQATENAAVALEWQQTTLAATEGNILFMDNCARCHTRGWSLLRSRRPAREPGTRPDGWRRLRTQPHRRRRRPAVPVAALRRRLLRLDLRRRARLRGLRHAGHLVGSHATLRRRAHEGTQIEAIMEYERSL